MHLREFNLREMAEVLYSDVSIPNRSVFDLLIEPFSEARLREIWEDRRPFQKILSETLPAHLRW